MRDCSLGRTKRLDAAASNSRATSVSVVISRLLILLPFTEQKGCAGDAGPLNLPRRLAIDLFGSRAIPKKGEPKRAVSGIM